MNLSSAARSSIHQLLDLFVGGAALQRLAQRILRRAQRLFGFRDVAVLEHHRHRPQPRHHVAQAVVVLGARELPVDRAQPEIDVGLRREALRRDASARRARSARWSLALASSASMRRCSISARGSGLANGRSGSRISCGAGAALVVGLVAGDQRHGHVDAGPGMLGQILGGLADARCGCAPAAAPAGNSARRTADAPACRRAARCGLAFEGRLRVDHAVVVLELVGQQQRAAQLAPSGSLASAMVGGRSGMALKVQATSSPRRARWRCRHPVMVKRRSSVPLGACGRASAATSRDAAGRPRRRDRHRRWRAPPGSSRPAPSPGRWRALRCSPGRKPGRISGGRPV